MNETRSVKSGGISFVGMLTIVFITLKLAQIGPVAAWSWWWVLSPLWISMLIGIASLVFVLVVYLVVSDGDDV